MVSHFILPLYGLLQIDPSNGGRVGAAEAALFLKKSGLSDLVLGKVWDLADSEEKGFLNKQEFFIALRLVSCAQNGLDVSLSSLNLPVPAPAFNDTNSPLPVGGAAAIDVPWAVKLEEKMKYDIIFDSLNPVNGFLSGDKVKPVLLNSKLPVDVLGRVWDLSDSDHDGLLDRDEFAVAMFLVYRALEKEPVPLSLAPALVPPSKRKKVNVPPPVPCRPSSPSAKESRQNLPHVPILPSVKWVVSPADKTKYDEIFMKTDKDQDGYVSGLEVKDIFLTTGLPSNTLAHIWALCDTNDCGKLTKEQFALALHLINQKLTKGIDPPQVLTAEMMPPSDSTQKNGATLNSLTDFSAIKELDCINNEILSLFQELEDEVDKESTKLQKLQEQRQEVQEVLSGLNQQKNKLEEQLNDIRQKCGDEIQLISSLKEEITSQATQICTYEEELSKAQEELSRLHQETWELEERVEASRAQLEPMQESLQTSQQEINQVISWAPCTELRDYTLLPGAGCSLEPTKHTINVLTFNFGSLINFPADPFKDDPFGKVDIADPFGGDPFKGTDPFADASENFFKSSSSDPFASAGSDPFSDATSNKNSIIWVKPYISERHVTLCVPGADPFTSLFGTDSFGSGFADFSTLSEVTSSPADPFSSSTVTEPITETFGKNGFTDEPVKNEEVPPALPPKIGTPTRPPPPVGKRLSLVKTESSDSFKLNDPFKPFGSGDLLHKENHNHLFQDPFAPTSPTKDVGNNLNFANFNTYPSEEDQIEWAKRESERAEKERLARLNQQEQEDLELAIALSKSEISEA
uniref:Epidermal growth factor receptor pathway substrate 15 n=1 Tax=Callorhinchus milii TaxID=7868 RepID=A0A4W3IZD1_CALMI